MSKSNKQYREEERCRLVTEEERKESDRRYAIKMVETIFFGFIKMVLVAFAVALIALVIRSQV